MFVFKGIFFKANCVEASFIRSLDSNLSSRSYIRWTSIGSRNSSVGRALDWRSKGPWFNPGFRQKLRRLPLQFFQLLFHFVNTPSTVQLFDSCTSRFVTGGGNQSSQRKPPPNPKSLSTFSHALSWTCNARQRAVSGNDLRQLSHQGMPLIDWQVF